MGRFSVRLFVRLFIPPQGYPVRLEAQSARPSQPDVRPSQPGRLTGSQAWLDGHEGDGWTDVQMSLQTNKWTENIPILQDFVPYQGRFPCLLPRKPKKNLIQKQCYSKVREPLTI